MPCVLDEGRVLVTVEPPEACLFPRPRSIAGKRAADRAKECLIYGPLHASGSSPLVPERNGDAI